jgi:hypothetical protein
MEEEYDENVSYKQSELLDDDEDTWDTEEP